MKLYDSARAPNPRRVRIFLAKRGSPVPTEQVDLIKFEQKSEVFRALNPLERTPVLRLDDGTAIAVSSLSAAILKSCSRSRRSSVKARAAALWSRCGRGGRAQPSAAGADDLPPQPSGHGQDGAAANSRGSRNIGQGFSISDASDSEARAAISRRRPILDCRYYRVGRVRFSQSRADPR